MPCILIKLTDGCTWMDTIKKKIPEGFVEKEWRFLITLQGHWPYSFSAHGVKSCIYTFYSVHYMYSMCIVLVSLSEMVIIAIGKSCKQFMTKVWKVSTVGFVIYMILKVKSVLKIFNLLDTVGEHVEKWMKRWQLVISQKKVRSWKYSWTMKYSICNQW